MPAKPVRARNYDEVAELVAEKVAKTAGKISAKRLLPGARAVRYEGSDRKLPGVKRPRFCAAPMRVAALG